MNRNNLNTVRLKILAYLFFVFSIFSQNAFSQEEKKEGVKLSQAKEVYKSQNSALPLGDFRHPTKAIWVSFDRSNKVFQCRISNDGWVYKSQGTLKKDNQITWANFWATSKITKKKGKLILKSKNEKLEFIWVNRISNYDCSSPIPYKAENKASTKGAGTGVGEGPISGTKTSGEGTGSGSGIGFGRGNGLPPRPASSRTKTSPLSSSLQILSKPAAGYTREARRNNVQGMVRLRVTFLANGKIGSVSAVKGLPHGLTQRAIIAARGITFKPATKNGVPYSVKRVVAYNFNIY